jgi:hypothetical protein
VLLELVVPLLPLLGVVALVVVADVVVPLLKHRAMVLLRQIVLRLSKLKT